MKIKKCGLYSLLAFSSQSFKIASVFLPVSLAMRSPRQQEEMSNLDLLRLIKSYQNRKNIRNTNRDIEYRLKKTRTTAKERTKKSYPEKFKTKPTLRISRKRVAWISIKKRCTCKYWENSWSRSSTAHVFSAIYKTKMSWPVYRHCSQSKNVRAHSSLRRGY